MALPSCRKRTRLPCSVKEPVISIPPSGKDWLSPPDSAVRRWAQSSAFRPAPGKIDGERTMYESAHGDITFAFTGDAMISRALKPFREPQFLKLRDLLHGVDT